jgi:hypothetical protein
MLTRRDIIARNICAITGLIAGTGLVVSMFISQAAVHFFAVLFVAYLGFALGYPVVFFIILPLLKVPRLDRVILSAMNRHPMRTVTLIFSAVLSIGGYFPWAHGLTHESARDFWLGMGMMVAGAIMFVTVLIQISIEQDRQDRQG